MRRGYATGGLCRLEDFGRFEQHAIHKLGIGGVYEGIEWCVKKDAHVLRLALLFVPTIHSSRRDYALNSESIKSRLRLMCPCPCSSSTARLDLKPLHAS